MKSLEFSRRVTIPSLCFLVFIASATAFADPALQEKVEEADRLLKEGSEEEGYALLLRLYDQYPEEWRPAIELGAYHSTRKNYSESVLYYEETLRRANKHHLPPQGLAQVHHQLVYDYNELGQQRYFSPELCLRILYYLDQV